MGVEAGTFSTDREFCIYIPVITYISLLHLIFSVGFRARANATWSCNVVVYMSSDHLPGSCYVIKWAKSLREQHPVGYVRGVQSSGSLELFRPRHWEACSMEWILQLRRSSSNFS